MMRREPDKAVRATTVPGISDDGWQRMCGAIATKLFPEEVGAAHAARVSEFADRLRGHRMLARIGLPMSLRFVRHAHLWYVEDVDGVLHGG